MSLDELIHGCWVEICLGEGRQAQNQAVKLAPNLVRYEKVSYFFLQDRPFCLQILHILRNRPRGDHVIQFVAFTEVELDEPRRQHHPLCEVLFHATRKWMYETRPKSTLPLFEYVQA